MDIINVGEYNRIRDSNGRSGAAPYAVRNFFPESLKSEMRVRMNAYTEMHDGMRSGFAQKAFSPWQLFVADISRHDTWPGSRLPLSLAISEFMDDRSLENFVLMHGDVALDSGCLLVSANDVSADVIITDYPVDSWYRPNISIVGPGIMTKVFDWASERHVSPLESFYMTLLGMDEYRRVTGGG